MDFNPTSAFDIDLKYGQHVEEALLLALQGKIEVKAERNHWLKTGNIAIEVSSRGKPSGICVTEAAHWAQVLMRGGSPFCYLIFPTPVLKGIVRYYTENRPELLTRGGDSYTSELVLLPLKEIINPK